MTSLFKKAAVFTDIHFGAKSNSDVHNEDCIEFIKWMISVAKEQGCETCLFLGDYHNNRAAMNIKTMGYALAGLELLNDNFENTYFIPGNHDLFYRDRREAYSTPWARHLPNVTICNDWFEQDQVVIAPWLVGDDYKKLQKMSGKYLFGHFELPGYLMNAMIAMPDSGDLKANDLSGFGHVFSGHFHKRQSSRNITYIGNCFPHNYSDAGDDERGFMILEWDKEPAYYAWPKQPTYRVYKISEVVENPEKLLKEKMSVRLVLDVELSYEEANYVKETFVDTYGLRDLSIVPDKNVDELSSDSGDAVAFESVDQIVTTQLNAIESKQYDPNILLKIYQNL